MASRSWGDQGSPGRGRRGPGPDRGGPRVYLDGGFGVGKTHLLASLWHAARTGGTLDHFVDVTRHLERIHPSRYRALLDHVPSVGWQSVRTISDQVVALRLVVLADRL